MCNLSSLLFRLFSFANHEEACTIPNFDRPIYYGDFQLSQDIIKLASGRINPFSQYNALEFFILPEPYSPWLSISGRWRHPYFLPQTGVQRDILGQFERCLFVCLLLSFTLTKNDNYLTTFPFIVRGISRGIVLSFGFSKENSWKEFLL